MIDGIYEAAAIPEIWPQALDALAERFDCRSVAIYAQSSDGVHPFISTRSEHLVAEFNAGGWSMHNQIVVDRLLAAPDPGFTTHLDWFTPDQIDRLDIVTGFWRPQGIIGCAGTLVQGANDDGIIVGFDGFGSEERARAMVPVLDRLRPTLARAVALTARVQHAKATAAMAGLAAIGTGAALITARGRIGAATPAFERRMGAEMLDRVTRLGFRNPQTDAAFLAILAEIGRADAAGRSLAVGTAVNATRRGEAGAPPFALHIVPIRAQARDLFGDHAALLLIADGANRSVPHADLLRTLFDLTVAEARVARRLVGGDDVAEIAAAHNVSLGTIRSQLKSIFAKTNVDRQIDLVMLLSGYGHGDPGFTCDAGGDRA